MRKRIREIQIEIERGEEIDTVRQRNKQRKRDKTETEK